jgi:hypothetical protein
MIRAYSPSSARIRVSADRNRCSRVSTSCTLAEASTRPGVDMNEVGNQPTATAKSRIRSIPSQNSGIA